MRITLLLLFVIATSLLAPAIADMPADQSTDIHTSPDLQQAQEARDLESSDRVSWPRKRSTMLLNKLVNALNKAMAKEKTESSFVPDSDPMGAIAMPSVSRSYQDSAPYSSLGSKDRMVWKCYFNAVSCF